MGSALQKCHENRSISRPCWTESYPRELITWNTRKFLTFTNTPKELSLVL